MGLAAEFGLESGKAALLAVARIGKNGPAVIPLYSRSAGTDHGFPEQKITGARGCDSRRRASGVIVSGVAKPRIIMVADHGPIFVPHAPQGGVAH